MKFYIFYSLLSISLFIISCKFSPSGPITMNPEEVESTLQKRLIEATDGETILLPEGIFSFKRGLSFIDIPNVTIKGMGMKKTILSFKEQIEGAEGLSIKNAKNISIEGLTIADSKGDALKLHECVNVIIRDVEATWTDGAKETNGAYGLYPVSCQKVLMEKCEASFAMDAGIYIGQSRDVVIRDNYAHHNVAGIEIENTQRGEVYDNVSRNNAGGLLIFDMPGLPQANGFDIKVFDNLVEDNNGPNFSKPGTVVNTLSPGTGMLVMAHRDVEVYNNTIKNHKTSGIGFASWLFTGDTKEYKDYDPYNTNISVYDNTIEGTKGPCDSTTDFGKLFTVLFDGKAFDIMIDGIYKPGTVDEDGNPTNICIKDNGENLSFVNLNAGMGGSPEEMAANMSMDMSVLDCEMPTIDLGEFDDWIVGN